ECLEQVDQAVEGGSIVSRVRLVQGSPGAAILQQIRDGVPVDRRLGRSTTGLTAQLTGEVTGPSPKPRPIRSGPSGIRWPRPSAAPETGRPAASDRGPCIDPADAQLMIGAGR